MNLAKQYGGARRSFGAYWRNYGGLGAVLGSPYLLASLVLTALMAPLWLSANWWDTVLGVLPNVLGFSIGGFAIFLAFGDDGFRNLLAGKHQGDDPDEPSPYVVFSATFLHFIVVQVLAVLLALCAKSFYLIKLDAQSGWTAWNHIIKPVWWFIGFGAFCYAICSALAAGMAIFTLTRSFDQYVSTKKEEEE